MVVRLTLIRFYSIRYRYDMPGLDIAYMHYIFFFLLLLNMVTGNDRDSVA